MWPTIPTMRWLAVACAAAFCVACGSSSKDKTPDTGNGGGGEVPVVVLPEYLYELAISSDDPLVVTVDSVEEGRTVFQMTHVAGMDPGETAELGLYGSYLPDTGEFTLSTGELVLTLVEIEGEGRFSDTEDEQLRMSVIETFVIPAGDFPTAGQLTVGFGSDRVFVTVLPDGLGVTLELDLESDGVISDPVTLSWDQFDDLENLEAPFWMQVTRFGFSATVYFMYELAGFGVDALERIHAGLSDTSPLTTACPALSAIGWAPPPPPPVIPDQGQVVLGWFDDTADGAVNTGDSFNLDYTYCLLPDDEDDFQTLANGALELNNYVSMVADGKLVEFGFDAGETAAGRPGGLVFDELELLGIEAPDDNPLNASFAEEQYTISGRMMLVFYAPDTSSAR